MFIVQDMMLFSGVYSRKYEHEMFCYGVFNVASESH